MTIALRQRERSFRPRFREEEAEEHGYKLKREPGAHRSWVTVVPFLIIHALYANPATVAQEPGERDAASQTPIRSTVDTDFWDLSNLQRDLIDAQLKEGLQDRHFSHAPIFRMASKNEIGLIKVSLEEGKAYDIIGVCSDYGADLDLTLYDETMSVVAADSGNDATPHLSVPHAWAGDYVLELAMVSCPSTCVYAVAIFKETDQRPHR
jgi:hypothetical protein